MTTTQQDQSSGPIYSLKAVLDKQPIQITGAVMAVMNIVVAADVWHPTAGLLAAINTGLTIMFGMFVGSKTANKRVLNDIVVPAPAAPVPPPGP